MVGEQSLIILGGLGCLMIDCTLQLTQWHPGGSVVTRGSRSRPQHSDGIWYLRPPANHFSRERLT